MLATFKDGGLMTPTPVTDAMHDKCIRDYTATTEQCYAKMRWHAESLERETYMLQSEIKKLKFRIKELEPPYL
jgi:hypothetical protein